MIRPRFILLLTAIVLLVGCAPKGLPSDPLNAAGNRADNLGANLGSASDEATRLADAVKREATAGKAATPATLVEAHQHWYAILQLVDPLKQFAVKLKTFVADADAIKADVEQAKVERAALQAELENEKSANKRKFIGVQCLLAIGGAIAVGLLCMLKRYSAAFAAAAGALAGIALLWFAMGLHAATRPFFITLGIVAGLAVAWNIAETIWRKTRGRLTWGAALLKAVRTPPWEDVEDAFVKGAKG